MAYLNQKLMAMDVGRRNALLTVLGALGGAAGAVLGHLLLNHGPMDIGLPLSGAIGGATGGYFGAARRLQNLDPSEF